MDVLKSTIKEVESKLYLLSTLTTLTGYNDYFIKANGGYASYTFTHEQVKRLDTLLTEFKREMEDEIAPTQQKLATLEQLLG